jgi:hypothetical protein
MTINRFRLVRFLTLVLVIGVVAAPAASARVISDSVQGASAAQFLTAPAQTVTVVKSNGFDWADAGIGAGAVVVLVLAGLGVRLAAGRGAQPSTPARSTVSAA